MKVLRDADGDVWTEQPDGTFRSPCGTDGWCRTEPSERTLDLWYGPLTEVPNG